MISDLIRSCFSPCRPESIDEAFGLVMDGATQTNCGITLSRVAPFLLSDPASSSVEMHDLDAYDFSQRFATMTDELTSALDAGERGALVVALGNHIFLVAFEDCHFELLQSWSGLYSFGEHLCRSHAPFDRSNLVHFRNLVWEDERARGEASTLLFDSPDLVLRGDRDGSRRLWFQRTSLASPTAVRCAIASSRQIT